MLQIEKLITIFLLQRRMSIQIVNFPFKLLTFSTNYSTKFGLCINKLLKYSGLIRLQEHSTKLNHLKLRSNSKNMIYIFYLMEIERDVY
jgi:hypothetical protein